MIVLIRDALGPVCGLGIDDKIGKEKLQRTKYCSSETVSSRWWDVAARIVESYEVRIKQDC